MQDYGLNLTIKVRRSQLLSPKPYTVPLWTPLQDEGPGKKKNKKKILKAHISARRLSIDSLLIVFTDLGSRTHGYTDMCTCTAAPKQAAKQQNVSADTDHNTIKWKNIVIYI